MTASHRNLLFAALCFAGAGVVAWGGFVKNAWLGDPTGAKLATAVMFLGGAGGVYFLIHALPGRTGAGRPPLTLRFIPSPELAFEFSPAEDASAGPVTADAVRAALASGFGFVVESGGGDEVRLRGTIGPPRWVKAPSGEVVAEPQYARLTFRPGTDPAALRPENLLLASTEPNLTKNACVALAAALGPLRVRICGDSVWLPVSPDVFGPLVVRLMLTQPAVVPIRDQRADL